MKNGNCTKGLLRAALIAAVAMMMTFSAACGEDECADDEQLATYQGEEQCLKTCDSSDDCDGSDTCSEDNGLCLPGDDDGQDNQTNQNQNTNECESTADCDGDQVCEDNQCVDDEEPQNHNSSLSDEELCTSYCDLLYGCMDNCGIDGGQFTDTCMYGDAQTGETGCLDDVATDRDGIVELVYGDFYESETEVILKDEQNTCDDVKFIHCGTFGVVDTCMDAGHCEAATTVGNACEADDECDSGDLLAAECMGERDQQSGELIDGGECTAYSCMTVSDPVEGDTILNAGCGEGNGCMALPVFQNDEIGGICQSLCDGNADCGDDEACNLVGQAYEGDFLASETGPVPAGGARTCLPQCTEDDDCGQGLRCGEAGDCQLPCEGETADLCTDSGGSCEDFDGTEYCVFD